MSNNHGESISVVLPVCNRQECIEERVTSLLDDLSELSSSIQLVLVDDGSKDATPELLDELRRKYPQVDVLRQPTQVGPSAAVRKGLSRATGDFVFAHESYDSVDMGEVQQLWKLRTDPDIVMARARTRTRKVDLSLLEKLSQWGRRLEENWLGKSYQTSELQMYRREIVSNLAAMKAEEGTLEISHLSHRSIASPKIRTQQRISK